MTQKKKAHKVEEYEMPPPEVERARVGISFEPWQLALLKPIARMQGRGVAGMLKQDILKLYPQLRGLEGGAAGRAGAPASPKAGGKNAAG